jgi:hypothetical protein
MEVADENKNQFKDVAAELATGDQYDKAYQSPLRKH